MINNDKNCECNVKVIQRKCKITNKFHKYLHVIMVTKFTYHCIVMFLFDINVLIRLPLSSKF